MNKQFVKIVEDGKSYIVFKNPVEIDGQIKFINSDSGKNELGYYELKITYPVVDEKHSYRIIGYKRVDNYVDAEFEIYELPKVMRTFSKYSIMKYLIGKNLWDSFKQWLDEANLNDFWNVPLDFDEGDEYFQRGLTAFKTKFNFTDEQIEEMLETCKKTGV